MASPDVIPKQAGRIWLDQLVPQLILTQGPRSGSSLYFSKWLKSQSVNVSRLISSGSLNAMLGPMVACKLQCSFVQKNSQRPPELAEVHAQDYLHYCHIANIAIAVQRLTKHMRRVAVLDIDVHHGNGTQQIFYDRDDVLTVSLHGNRRLYSRLFVVILAKGEKV